MIPFKIFQSNFRRDDAEPDERPCTFEVDYFNDNSIKTKSIQDALSIFELELERLRVSIKTFKLNLDLRDFRMDEKFWDV